MNRTKIIDHTPFPPFLDLPTGHAPFVPSEQDIKTAGALTDALRELSGIESLQVQCASSKGFWITAPENTQFASLLDQLKSRLPETPNEIHIRSAGSAKAPKFPLMLSQSAANIVLAKIQRESTPTLTTADKITENLRRLTRNGNIATTKTKDGFVIAPAYPSTPGGFPTVEKLYAQAVAQGLNTFLNSPDRFVPKFPIKIDRETGVQIALLDPEAFTSAAKGGLAL